MDCREEEAMGFTSDHDGRHPDVVSRSSTRSHVVVLPSVQAQ